MNKLFVYLTTNLVNGRKYIGKCETGNPNYLGSGSAIKSAIKKYGKECFNREILYYANSKEDLKEMEEFYIFYYNAVQSPMYYNIIERAFGGGRDQHKIKKKVSQYDTQGNFLKEWGSAADAAKYYDINRTKIVTACRRGGSSAGYFWKRSADNIELQLDNGVGTWARKRVFQYSQEGKLLNIFKSITEAVKVTGIAKHKIYQCVEKFCSDEYVWEIENCGYTPYVPQPSKGKTIYQYDLEGNLVKINRLYKEIYDQGIKYAQVRQTIYRGTHKYAGFYWYLQLLPKDLVVHKRRPAKKGEQRKKVISKYVPVIQFLNGEFVAEYESIATASKVTGLEASNISAVCKGKRPICGGFTWQYKNAA